MNVASYDNEGNLTSGTYFQKCMKCNGRGKFVSYSGRTLGDCFACKGKGEFERKTSPEARAKAKAKTQRVAKKARTLAENETFFNAKYPEAHTWMCGKAATFAFAGAMLEAVKKYGELTERQMETVERLMKADAERDVVRAAEKAAREANAPTIKTDGLQAAFDHAAAEGLKRLKMRFDGFEISPAKATSANAGALYVKSGQTYLGKIMGGKFLASRDCTPADTQKIAETMADPLAAATAYGKKVGICSCCGRELTDPVSIANGIGPICEANYGF
jgi:hypothetical protein